MKIEEEAPTCLGNGADLMGEVERKRAVFDESLGTWWSADVTANGRLMKKAMVSRMTRLGEQRTIGGEAEVISGAAGSDINLINQGPDAGSS